MMIAQYSRNKPEEIEQHNEISPMCCVYNFIVLYRFSFVVCVLGRHRMLPLAASFKWGDRAVF